ncbi:MAG: hypothetical protein P4L91_20220 [Burkholderiaceae bacterium]|nr:hypothetical protein [Burkholderiaceae bacterium]
MKNVNIRALTFVAALVAIIAAGVTLVHPPRADTSWARFSERIDVRREPSSQRLSSGLELRVSNEGVSVSVPNCDMSSFQSRFFMHVYPAAGSGISNDAVGRDFDLSKEPAKHVTTQSGLQCVVSRAYMVEQAKEVVIGQFNTPGGRCCDIVWSRTFVIEQ